MIDFLMYLIFPWSRHFLNSGNEDQLRNFNIRLRLFVPYYHNIEQLRRKMCMLNVAYIVIYWIDA